MLKSSMDWRRPPQEVEKHCRALAKRLARRLGIVSQLMPWRSELRIRIQELKAPSSKYRLWILSDNPTYALWAAASASFVDFVASARQEDPRLSILTVASSDADKQANAPFIEWQLDRSGLAIEAAAAEHFVQFEQYLFDKISLDRPIDASNGTIRSAFSQFCNSDEIQSKVIDEFLAYLARLPAVDCSAEELARIVADNCSEPDASGRIMTRWTALQILRKHGVLDSQLRGHMSIRPVVSAVSLSDIIDMVEWSGLTTRAAVTSRSRKAGIVHGRYFTAAIGRACTSRSLSEIGHALGGRDHSTVVHGLAQIARLSQSCPAHERLFSSFAQCADHVGAFKNPVYRRMAAALL